MQSIYSAEMYRSGRQTWFWVVVTVCIIFNEIEAITGPTLQTLSSTATTEHTTVSYRSPTMDKRYVTTHSSTIDTTTSISSSHSSSQTTAPFTDAASVSAGNAVGIAIGSFIFGVLLTTAGFALCLYRGTQQSEKHDDGAADTTVAPEHQHSPSENGNRHAVDVTQMPSSAVVKDQNGVGGTEPKKHEVSSNNEYLDMSGAQPKNKIPPCPHPRLADAGKPGKDPTERTPAPSGLSSSGLYANLQKLSVRFGRGKLCKPRTEPHLYENVMRGSVYNNV